MSKVTTGAPALLLVVFACEPAAAQISVIGGEARGLVKRSHVVEFFSGAPTLEWPEQAFCEVVDFEPGRRAAVGGPDPGHVTLDPYAGVPGCPWFAIPTNSGMAIGQRGVLRFDSLLDVGRWSLLCQADFRQGVADDCAPLPCGFACDLESDNPIVFWMEVEVFNDAPSMTVSASRGTWGSASASAHCRNGSCLVSSRRPISASCSWSSTVHHGSSCHERLVRWFVVPTIESLSPEVARESDVGRGARHGRAR